jgi:LAO/AO transport system kinase
VPATADVDALVARALEGARPALARTLSLVDAGGDAARAVSTAVHPRTGTAWIVGITGAPGAGKSTLTDRLVALVRARGERVAVVAVDPTSPFSGGAILGDRVRMQDHATDDGVFIRSVATRGHLGGLSASVPAAARVLDAAGYPWVVIETVGVGQVEVEIAAHADTTIVVVNPGWGDAVQAAKAGLLEVADVFVVNKADRPGTRDTVRELDSMLELAGHGDGRWRPPIVETVATDGTGVQALVAAIAAHREHQRATGDADRRRRERVADELRAVVLERVAGDAAARCDGPGFDELVDAIDARTLDPYTAAAMLLGSPGTADSDPRG